MVRSKNTIATPPGATIREQLEDRGMTQKNFTGMVTFFSSVLFLFIALKFILKVHL